MRTVLVAVVIVAAPMAARAQSCTGLLAGTIGLALDEGGTVSPLPDTIAAHFFGADECACRSSDVRTHVTLTQALPAGTSGTVELWLGVGCADYAIRTEEDSPCGLVATGSIADFTTAGAGVVDLPGPGDACGRPFSTLTLILYTDPQQPFATCTMPIHPTQGRPAQPTTLGAARNPDGTITIEWQRPADKSLAPTTAYQILCADGRNARLYDPPESDGAYSICLPNQILERRTLGLSSDGTLGGGNFAALDHGFLCSPPLAADSASFVLPAPPAGRDAQLVVVAVDAWGDASASSVVTVAAPAPPSHGGCSVGPGGTPGTPPLVLFLLFATMIVWTSCRQARR
jgi:hypothetical protein